MLEGDQPAHGVGHDEVRMLQGAGDRPGVIGAGVVGLEPTHRLAREAGLVGEAYGAPGTDSVTEHVLAREADMGTGLGDGIAIPHARLDGMEQPVVAVGLSTEGIDWDAFDGKPAHLVFLVLTPSEDAESQLEILGAIAQAFASAEERRALLDAESQAAVWEHLKRCMAKQG